MQCVDDNLACAIGKAPGAPGTIAEKRPGRAEFRLADKVHVYATQIQEMPAQGDGPRAFATATQQP